MRARAAATLANVFFLEIGMTKLKTSILIHLQQLRNLTPEWLALSFKLKRDEEADKVFGWVLEMWGYTIAALRPDGWTADCCTKASRQTAPTPPSGNAKMHSTRSRDDGAEHR